MPPIVSKLNFQINCFCLSKKCQFFLHWNRRISKEFYWVNHITHLHTSRCRLPTPFLPTCRPRSSLSTHQDHPIWCLLIHLPPSVHASASYLDPSVAVQSLQHVSPMGSTESDGHHTIVGKPPLLTIWSHSCIFIYKPATVKVQHIDCATRQPFLSTADCPLTRLLSSHDLIH